MGPHPFDLHRVENRINEDSRGEFKDAACTARPDREDCVAMTNHRRRYRPGDRVRVKELDAAGRVVEIIGDQELVIVDLHDQIDRLGVDPTALEHLD